MSAASDTNRWNTPAAATAVAALAPLSEEARKLLQPQQSPKEFVTALNAAFLGVDAMKIIPFALTKREAVWWAAQCVKAVPALVQEPKCAAAVAAVEKWCEHPTDENRRVCYSASEAAEMKTPAGCVAMAVFLSEGSLGPPNTAVIPPPPTLGPGMAGNAVQLAAVLFFPEKASERYAIFAQMAEAVATGSSRWPEKLTGAPAAARSTATAPMPTGSTAAPTSQTAGTKSFPPYPQAKR